MEFKSGVYTVVPTIFKDDLEVDYDKIIDLISEQIFYKVKNIVLLGTTSETPTLSDAEQDKIVQLVWEKFNGKINIIIGIGGNNTNKTIQTGLKYYKFCDAFMVTVPYYNKPSQNGIKSHFSNIAKLLLDKPILLYNVPSRCGVSMVPETVAYLYNNFDNIKAIKEASGSLSIAQDIMSLCDIVLLSGDDSNTLPIMSVGGKGVVSVASNVIPEEILMLVKLFEENKLNDARVLNKKLYPIFKNLFIDTNPVPLKFILKKTGKTNCDTVRLPLEEISDEQNILKLNNISEYIRMSSLQEIKASN